MQGSEAIAKALVDQGVDTMFGVLGDGNLFIADPMIHEHGVHYVAATHEANAVMMAEGFSKASGKLGVATCTHGPGLTNTITALVEATRNRTPMILVTGDTATEDQQHLQKIGQRELVATTGAGFQLLGSPSTISADVANAVRRARAERRPIVLNIPVEIEWEEVEYKATPQPIAAPRALGADPEALDTALGVAATAARPVILAGRGAVKAGARDALVALGEALGAPLATSLLGTGFFRGEPHDLGIHGTLSSPVASEALASADCIISFGASLNYFTTHSGSMLEGKRVVQCDTDPNAIGQNVAVDAAVVGDAREIAETMVEMLAAAEHQPSAFASAELAGDLASFVKADSIDDKSTDTAVDPRLATIHLDDLLPEDRTLVVDAGRFMLDALTLSVPDPTALVTSHGFGSIGLGMSSAMGACVAHPERPTVLCIGDGGFMMGGLAEMHTAVHHGFDLIVVLYNDGSYGAEHIQLWNKQMDTSSSLHEWPDFVPVASSLGFDAVGVSNIGDLARAADVVKNRVAGKPVFIELSLDPDMVSSIPR